MIFVPVLVAIGQARGFVTATAAGAAAFVLVALPLSAFAVRHPTGGLTPTTSTAETGGRTWTRAETLRTRRFWTLSIAFGLALMAQVGFIVHQLAFLEPTLGHIQAALVVSATTVSALLGRVVAGALADRMDQRVLSAAIFAVQAVALAVMAAWPAPSLLFAGSVAFGLGVGNIITLPPLLARAEFGARSFATVFGMASAAMQLGVAIGPGLVGALRDATNDYAVAVAVLAGLDALAVAGVLWGRRGGAAFDTPTPTR
jgi:cyanate permease